MLAHSIATKEKQKMGIQHIRLLLANEEEFRDDMKGPGSKLAYHNYI